MTKETNDLYDKLITERVQMAKDTVPAVRSFSEAARAAGLPVVIDRETIAELGPVVWIGARSAQAKNPQTGQLGNGLMAELITDEGHKYTSFIGNVALLQVLGVVDDTNPLDEPDTDPPNRYFIPREDVFPFRGAIKKSGRTWVFVDE